ncbi:hypothetical protein HY405_00780 [Candidatus Microgenomates bacterium]|nr:hypothetical protein [Candidatus Microgenomates bacterium]
MIDPENKGYADQTILYSYICRKLTSGGISREEFGRIKNYPIGHNSVEGFVRLNIVVGNLEWRGDILINADCKLTLKLTADEQERLSKKSKELGMTESELATKIVLGTLERGHTG